MKKNKKKLGGVDYIILGSTIERIGMVIVLKKYTTTKGIVIIENGMVRHPDGTTSNV